VARPNDFAVFSFFGLFSHASKENNVKGAATMDRVDVAVENAQRRGWFVFLGLFLVNRRQTETSIRGQAMRESVFPQGRSETLQC
jgi:hypothetical protein